MKCHCDPAFAKSNSSLLNKNTKMVVIWKELLPAVGMFWRGNVDRILTPTLPGTYQDSHLNNSAFLDKTIFMQQKGEPGNLVCAHNARSANNTRLRERFIPVFRAWTFIFMHYRVTLYGRQQLVLWNILQHVMQAAEQAMHASAFSFFPTI